MSDETDLAVEETPPKTTAVSGFTRASAATPDDEDEPEVSGVPTQQDMADDARKENDAKRKKPTGFFRKAAGGGDTGFALAGSDADGNGFTLPLSSPSLMGHKWSGFKRTWFKNDQRTMQFADKLNPGFDKIIKRAIKNNWTHIGLQSGLVGKIDAPAPLIRALNRRIQELAGGGKDADKAIKAMGFRPEMVRAQLQNLSAHSGHIDEVFADMRAARQPPAGAPTVTPP